MKGNLIAFCEKALEQANTRLAFLETFEAQVLELNRQRLSELKNARLVEIDKWKMALEQAVKKHRVGDKD